MRKYVIALVFIVIFCVSGCDSENSSSVIRNSYDRVESENNSSATISETSATSMEKSTVVNDTQSTPNSSDQDQSAVNSEQGDSSETVAEEVSKPVITSEPYTRDTRISDVISDPVLGNYGRLIFPVDKGYYSGETLDELRLTWYNNIDPDTTVEIANYMRSHAESGDVIFYDIYSDEE